LGVFQGFYAGLAGNAPGKTARAEAGITKCGRMKHRQSQELFQNRPLFWGKMMVLFKKLGENERIFLLIFP